MSGEWISRRDWLVERLTLWGVPPWTAREAVASTVLAHPETDYDELDTRAGWEER